MTTSLEGVEVFIASLAILGLIILCDVARNARAELSGYRRAAQYFGYELKTLRDINRDVEQKAEVKRKLQEERDKALTEFIEHRKKKGELW